MHILLISDERWDSGLSHYALALGSVLRARSHHVHFWGRAGAPPYLAAQRAGLHVHDVSRPWARLAELRRYLIDHHIEVINPHTGSSHSLAVFLSRTLAFKPLVVRTRGDARPVRRRPLGRWLMKRTAGHICANRRILAELRAAYPSLEAPAVAIPPGVDTAAFEPRPLPGKPSVGLVARLDPVKGHADLLRAAARIKDQVPGAEYWLAGPEANIKSSELRALADSLGLGPEVHLTGRVERVDHLMALCQVGVVVSLGSEAVSRAALEWMASGRALVATAVGQLPELVDDGVTGWLVPPGDPEALAAKLALLLRKPELALRLGAAARERAEREFSLGAFAQRSEAFLESLLEEAEVR